MHWIILSALYFLSLSSALLTTREQQQQQEGRQVFVRDGICGTETPSPALKDAHKRLAFTDTQRVANANGEDDKPKKIEVETYFHVVSTKDQVDLVTNEMIASQVHNLSLFTWLDCMNKLIKHSLSFSNAHMSIQASATDCSASIGASTTHGHRTETTRK